MIKSMTVTNALGESLKMVLSEPWDTGLLIESIDGLGPVKATINSTDYATVDGVRYNSSRKSYRNIVVHFQIVEQMDTDGKVVQTVEEVRHKCYQFFQPKYRVSLEFDTDTHLVKTNGYVESNEPDIFQQTEKAQISIICEDPYLYSMDYVSVVSGIKAEFEFPFSSEASDVPIETREITYPDFETPFVSEPSIEFGHIDQEYIRVEFDPDISFGEILSDHQGSIYYPGDTGSGALFIINIHGSVQNLGIYNLITRQSMELNSDRIQAITGSGLSNGDSIRISTFDGDKYCKLIRSAREYNILSALPKTTDWITIARGNNIIYYSAASGSENVTVEVRSSVRYEGI